MQCKYESYTYVSRSHRCDKFQRGAEAIPETPRYTLRNKRHAHEYASQRQRHPILHHRLTQPLALIIRWMEMSSLLAHCAGSSSFLGVPVPAVTAHLTIHRRPYQQCTRARICARAHILRFNLRVCRSRHHIRNVAFLGRRNWRISRWIKPLMHWVLQ